MTKIAVMASGSGTILSSMIERRVPISLVLADKACKALEIAASARIPTMLVQRNSYGYRKGIGDDWDRAGFTRAVTRVLNQYGIDVAAMAGFFTVLSPSIFDEFAGEILNIHPALLPDFPGEFAVRDALAAGASESGSTVHIATPVIDDASYIVAQVKVPTTPGDDVDTLWERIKVQERELYPQVLLDILAGRIKLSDIKANAT